MNVDRIARAMTSGRPSRGFTGRVMAPIHGRPRPDFTKRVMDRLESREVPQSFSAVARPFSARVLLLVPAAIALAAVALVVRSAARVPAIPAPPAPRMADVRLNAPVVVTPVVTPDTRRRQRSRPARAEVAATAAADPPIYTIAALEGPSDLEMKSIDPGSCTVAPLNGPAPIKVTDLPAQSGGSRNQNFKERP